MLVRWRGLGIDSVKGLASVKLGSRTVALMAANSLMLRRSTLKKNDAFLPSGPPMFPLYCVES